MCGGRGTRPKRDEGGCAERGGVTRSTWELFKELVPDLKRSRVSLRTATLDIHALAQSSMR